MRTRLAVGGAGLTIGLIGAYLLLSRQDGGQLFSAAVWLASGVVLHDFVLAPVVLVLVAVGGRTVPAGFRAPTVAGLVVLGSVTVLAIPVLSGMGRRSDNPTLLDRNYTLGWLVLLLLVVLVVVVAGLAMRSRGSTAARRETGAEPGARRTSGDVG